MGGGADPLEPDGTAEQHRAAARTPVPSERRERRHGDVVRSHGSPGAQRNRRVGADHEVDRLAAQSSRRLVVDAGSYSWRLLVLL